uniref:Uncharacterized protein n=1 Tax=Anguilla anguilla TaxID=7936 RepID=A0A0E9UGG5_ANGAN
MLAQTNHCLLSGVTKFLTQNGELQLMLTLVV